MTRKEFVTKAVEILSEHYSPGESKALAVRILTHFLGLSDYEYSVDPGVTVPRSGLKPLEKALEELAIYRPVQYVIGKESFAGHEFNVCEDVLIPRPETEQLCRIAEKMIRAKGNPTTRILDACTGSGCIAYTLAALFPKAEILGCDISDRALEIAQGQQVYINGQKTIPLPQKPIFFKADILEEPSAAGIYLEDMDFIFSNPPYVMESEKDTMDENVLGFEPHLALFVPDNDPLRFYRALGKWAMELLVSSGEALFEINEFLAKETAELFESMGFSDVEIIEDFRDKKRFVHFTKW